MTGPIGHIGVAISTTGDPHRLGFLETCVAHWDKALPPQASLFVTVDGDEEAHARVTKAVLPYTGSVYRVGQPRTPGFPLRDGRLGVAVNKNTGIELLMGGHTQYRRIEHLFLSDDDCWPLHPQALTKHMEMDTPHSMVCWGRGRLLASRDDVGTRYAEWSWPRGVMLYTRRHVIETVGGMDERFGPGGHEHAEWSRRIHQAGFTSAPFMSPAHYALDGPSGRATRASMLWNCEDMPRPGEHPSLHRQRKHTQTSIRRTEADWEAINKIMVERDGDTSFVPYQAHQNGRQSATLWLDDPSRGAERSE